MAVENKYVNADVVAEKLATPALISGDKTVAMVATFEVAAADDDGSIYRLFKNLTPELIPVKIEIYNDVITGGTSFDLGLYETLSDGLGGNVVDANALLAAESLAVGHARGAPLDGLKAVDIANAQKTLAELGGHTVVTKKKGYDIALTGNVVGTAAGTVTVVATFVQGR